ncbi:MAG: hypothetical protein IPM29_11265 [Planctomycetes bacterium]|nr:hypothetical protein [Planctomycetota bacterium]
MKSIASIVLVPVLVALVTPSCSTPEPGQPTYQPAPPLRHVEPVAEATPGATPVTETRGEPGVVGRGTVPEPGGPSAVETVPGTPQPSEPVPVAATEPVPTPVGAEPVEPVPTAVAEQPEVPPRSTVSDDPSVEEPVATPAPTAEPPVATTPAAAVEPAAGEPQLTLPAELDVAALRAVYAAIRADIRGDHMARAEATFQLVAGRLDFAAADPRHEVAEDVKLLGGFLASMRRATPAPGR